MKIAVWIQAARPKTLIASAAPVAVGASLVKKELDIPVLAATLAAALAIQIATNFANDYFDFLKGADTDRRKGPVRVTQAGLATPRQMKRALMLILFVATFAALPLILRGGLPIAFLTTISLILSIGYTAGPAPIAYLGLGDLFVLFFFGPVATAAAYYLQTGSAPSLAWLSGLGLGLLSTAILTVNNLRDLDEDRAAGKKTLSVRFGRRFGCWQYTLCIAGAAMLPLLWGWQLPLLLAAPGAFLIGKVWKVKDPRELNPLLAQTAMLLALDTVLSVLSK